MFFMARSSRHSQGRHTSQFVLAVIAIVLLLAAIGFFSVNLTGYTISNVSSDGIVPIGLTFFFLGLVGVYLWLKQH